MYNEFLDEKSIEYIKLWQEVYKFKVNSRCTFSNAVIMVQAAKIYILELDIYMVDVFHSSRGLVDSRAVHGKPNRTFCYLLPYHASDNPHANPLSVGDILLRTYAK